MAEKLEYIICAANYYDNGNEYEHQCINTPTGLVISGRRHHNCFTTVYLLSENILGKQKPIQGFITNTNRFVNRQEAYAIAYAADQIIGPNKGRPTNSIGLTSEDLY